jgi:hypothetical protein
VQSFFCAEGYKPAAAGLQHYRILAALPLILGDARKDDAEYLETCRRKRNTVEYDRVGTTTEAEVRELLEFTDALRKNVRRWLTQRHPELV